MKTRIFPLLFVAILLCTQACECGKGKNIPDVSDIQVQADIKRFEQDLFAIDTNQVAPGLAALEAAYPEFSEVFFAQVLGSTDSTIAPEGHEKYVRGFISHPAVRRLNDTCQVVFPDLAWAEKEFQQAFRFFKYYFPEEPLSGEVVTYISEYTLGGFLYGENSIGLGLDFFLGEGYPYMKYNPGNANFSQYLVRTFNKDYLVMKPMKLLVQDLLGGFQGERLIDHMIHHGKALYILDRLMPYAADSVRLEFSQQQIKWCENNEANIWAYFITENLLYSTDFGKFRKFIEYSPNSPGMPDEAPGRTANWLGWQIIKAFMSRNPELSLTELMDLKDAQQILDQSKYKPAR